MVSVWIHYLFFCFVFIAFLWDIATKKIPNLLNLFGFISGFILQTVCLGGDGAGFALAGAAVGFAVTFPLYAIGAIGAGDVKWFAASGTFLGVNQVISLLIVSIVLSGFIASVGCTFSGSIRKSCRHTALRFMNWTSGTLLHKPAYVQFPFMVSVLPAAIYTVFR